MKSLRNSALEKLTWVFSPGHAGVLGNERADTISGTAAIDNNLTLDPPTVLKTIQFKVLLIPCLASKRKGFKLG